MYTIVTNCNGNFNTISCKDLYEACKLAYKLKDQFCNIQKDNKIIYNRIKIDDLVNIVFENIWKRELLE